MAKRRKAAKAVAMTVARQASSAGRAVGRQVITVMRSPRARAVGRRAVGAVSAQAIAQAKIAPGMLGGYVVARVERAQRKAHSEGVAKDGGKGKSGALIVNPTTRLAVMAGVLAYGASKTTGMIRDAIIGASGAIGALYEMYSASDTMNPADDFLKKIAAGESGT